MTALIRRRDLGLDTIAHLAPQGLGRALTRATAIAWEPVAFSLSRNGPMPDRLHALPQDPRRGSIDRGNEMLRGRFDLAGAVLDCPRGGPWTAPMPASQRFREALAGFAWLADLGAVDRADAQGRGTARETARALFASFLDTHASFSEPAWRPDIVGRRIMSWLAEAPILAEGSDLSWRMRLNQTLGHQARYLNQTADIAPAGLPRLTATLGLLLACLALGDAGPRRQKASARLIAELEAQIQPDGGHTSRSPAVQMNLVCDLLMLKDAFVQSNTPMPLRLTDAIERATALLRLLHLGDGTLAFADLEGDPAVLRSLLESQAAPGAPLLSAPQSGFQRLDFSGTILVADTGETPASGVAEADGSRFGFEIASGAERIAFQPGLMLGDIAHPVSGAMHIEAQRRDDGMGGALLELCHDAYAEAYGRKLARRLYVPARGGDVRGEDRIEPIEGVTAQDISFRLRFILHPHIVVELDQGSALLALPRGEVWRFQCRGSELKLAETVHHGPAGAQPAPQLVVEGLAGEEPLTLRWAFKREAGEPGAA